MNKSGIVIFYLLIMILGSVTLPAQANVTEVTAMVDKNPAMADESITLRVVANGDADRNAFDPSALLRDFVVGRTSMSSQTQMVNFKTTRSTTWSTTLIPRTAGDFIIPSFTVAGLATQPLPIKILPVTAAQGGQARSLFITASTDTPQVYLQQQIKYTVKLHLAVDLQRGSLAAPSLENADVRQIGKDAEYTDIINGQRYRIIERTFAITPQQSGTFRINGPLFEGEVIDNSRQSFGFFNRTKTINRVGPPVDITVLPIPASTIGHWLPSEFVQLNEEWQPAPEQYKVGDPITRTITLTAVGLVEEQLPEIASQYPDAVKTYPDQATTATVERDNTLIAQRVENIAIIPSTAGRIIIPEVTIPWFNVVTKQTEYATLPARTLDVAAATEQPQSTLPLLPAPVSESPQTKTDAVVPAAEMKTTLSWWSVSSIVFLLLWLLTIAAWAFQSTRKNTTLDNDMQGATPDKHWAALTKALQSNDVKRIYHPLTNWLAWYSGNESNALPTSQRIINDHKLDTELKSMFEQQYGKHQSVWRSDQLLTQLTRLKAVTQNNQKSGVSLKPLYPNQRSA